jgi:hypothetical protein
MGGTIEQIALLRERIATLEEKAKAADTALKLAADKEARHKDSSINLTIGIITIGLMALGTLITLISHLFRGG